MDKTKELQDEIKNLNNKIESMWFSESYDGIKMAEMKNELNRLKEQLEAMKGNLNG